MQDDGVGVEEEEAEEGDVMVAAGWSAAEVAVRGDDEGDVAGEKEKDLGEAVLGWGSASRLEMGGRLGTRTGASLGRATAAVPAGALPRGRGSSKSTTPFSAPPMRPPS